MAGLRRLIFSRSWWLLAGLWFAMWHLFFTWEIWQDPMRLIPGPIGDNTVMIWNLAWVKYALSHGDAGFWFTNAYYPDGFLFLFGTHTWLDGLVGWMASPLLPAGLGGTILWANISMLMATVGTGVLIIAALRTWGISLWSVLLMASSAATFSWFRMFALTGHYHFFATQWMLLALWLVSKSRRDYINREIQAGRLWIILAGLALGLSFLNDQTMAVFAAILGVIIIFCTAVTVRERRGRTLLESLVLYSCCSLITASVHLIPVGLAIYDGSFKYKADIGAARFVDASSMFLPQHWHLLGPYVEFLRDEYGLTWSEGTYLGVVPLLLYLGMCIGSIRYLVTRKSTPVAGLRICFYCTLAASLFLLMALGDQLVIGRNHYMDLPGRLLKSIPVINNIRLPQRWVWPAHLCIALGGAIAFSIWIDRTRFRLAAWCPLVLALVAGIEGKKYQYPAPVDYRLDPFMNKRSLVRSVKDRYQIGGVLVMPVQPYFPYGNILQSEWGFDIPVTVSYTARMPFLPTELPWKGNQWTPEAGEWLKVKDVRIVVFPAHKDPMAGFAGWINSAKAAVPGLLVFNSEGKVI